MNLTLKYKALLSRKQKRAIARAIARFMRGKAHAYNYGVKFIESKEWKTQKN